MCLSRSLIQPEMVKCNLELLPSTPNSSPVWLAMGCWVMWCWRTFMGMQVECVSAVHLSVKLKLSGILSGYFFYSVKSERNLWSASWHSFSAFRPLYMHTHTQVQSIRYVVFSSQPRLNHSFHVQKSFFLAPSLLKTPLNGPYKRSIYSVLICSLLEGLLALDEGLSFFSALLSLVFFFVFDWYVK